MFFANEKTYTLSPNAFMLTGRNSSVILIPGICCAASRGAGASVTGSGLPTAVVERAVLPPLLFKACVETIAAVYVIVRIWLR